MTRRVIVNADDFGLTAGVNRAIEHAHRAGVVTSTTVMVNQADMHEAGDLARRCPDLDIGLHVNLSLGSPVSDPGRVRTLTDLDGRFCSVQELVRRLARRRLDPAEVRREVTAQFAQLEALGVRPSHWDSHQHAALWPGLVGPAAAAARDAGVRRVRSPRVWVIRPGASPAAARRRWVLAKRSRLPAQLARRAARLTLARDFAMPAWRASPDLVVGDAPYETRWDQALAGLPPGTSEIVAHPGEVDDTLRALTPDLTDQRSVDLAVLSDGALEERLRRDGVELIGFRRL